jgi:flagellar biosynthesis protein FlhB
MSAEAIGCSSMAKQFPPSSKKLQDLLDKGQVPRSDVLQRLCSYAGFWVTLLAILSVNIDGLGWRASRYFEASKCLFDPSMCGDLVYGDLVYGDIMVVAAIVTSPLLAASASSIVAQLYVCKFRFAKKGHKYCSTEFLAPGSLKSRLLKNAARAATFVIPFALFLIACLVVLGSFVCDSLHYYDLAPDLIGRQLWKCVWRELLWIGVLLVVWGKVDYLWERSHFLKEHRMDYKEVKDEYKEIEGDPFIKCRRRMLHQSMSESEIEARVKASRIIFVEPGGLDGRA